MLIDNRDVQQKLQAIANRLGRRLGVEEDLYQEMVFHLWQLEADKPDQEVSWYLKGCMYHARNYLRGGKSVDSHSKDHLRAESLESIELAEPVAVVNHDYESRMAAEILHKLSGQVSELRGRIIRLMSGGKTVAEVADEMSISHQAVSGHLKAIKAKVSTLKGFAEYVVEGPDG